MPVSAHLLHPGAGYWNGGLLDGKIAEQIVFSRALTLAEIEQVEAYLQTRY